MWKKGERCQGVPTVEESRAAEMQIIQLVQREAFGEEVWKLSMGQEISK